MATPAPRLAEDFKVEDSAAAFRKLQSFARRLLAVPKKKIDERMSEERSAKKAKRRKAR